MGPPEGGDTAQRRRMPGRIAAMIGALVAAPILVDLALSDRRRVFGYLAADAFYYLTVARNMATTGRSTFDGEFATNGYHPLWQWSTALAYAVCERVAGEPAVLLVAVLLGAALVAAGFAALVRLLPDHPVSRALAPLLVVGPTALAMAPAWLHLGPEGVLAHSWQGRGRPLAGTSWGYVNGMESCLVIASFAAASYVAVRRLPERSLRDAAALGLLLATMTLSRLDHALVAVGVLAPFGVRALRARLAGDRAPLRAAVVCGACFGAPIAAYLVTNALLFGSAMPVSGRLKSTFPAPSSSFVDALSALLGPEPPTYWLPFVVRITLLVVPSTIAAVWLAAALFRRTGDRCDRWMDGAALGVLVLAAYDIAFVPLRHQGHWYFPVSTTFSALAMVRAGALVPARMATGLVVGSLALSSVLVTALSFGLQRTPHNGHFAQFYYEVAPALREHYSTPPKLVSFDDGIVAFSTGFPTLSGLGFTLDVEAVDALERGQLLELAYARGYRHVTSLVYFPPWLLGPGVETRIGVLVRSWPIGANGKAPPFRFEIDYRTSDGEFVILSMSELDAE